MFKRKEPFVRTLFFLFNILRVNNRRMGMTDNTDSKDNDGDGDADNTGNTDNMGNAARADSADNSRRAPDILRVAIVVCPSFIPPLDFPSLIAYAPRENVYRQIPSVDGQTR